MLFALEESKLNRFRCDDIVCFVHKDRYFLPPMSISQFVNKQNQSICYPFLLYQDFWCMRVYLCVVSHLTMKLIWLLLCTCLLHINKTTTDFAVVFRIESCTTIIILNTLLTDRPFRCISFKNVSICWKTPIGTEGKSKS